MISSAAWISDPGSARCMWRGNTGAMNTAADCWITPRLTPGGSVSAKSISARNTSAITNATALLSGARLAPLGRKLAHLRGSALNPAATRPRVLSAKNGPSAKAEGPFRIHKVRTAARNRSRPNWNRRHRNRNHPAPHFPQRARPLRRQPRLRRHRRPHHPPPCP